MSMLQADNANVVTVSPCGYCYAVPAVKRCGKCKLRVYCSKPCQVADWKHGGHKHWCCRAGELGTDFEIRLTTDGKGFGVFALRPFEIGDKVLAERSILNLPRMFSVAVGLYQLQHQPEGVSQAVANLYPVGGDLKEKVAKNCAGYGDDPDISHVCIHFSRLNHACLPSCGCSYIEEHKVMLVSAAQKIEKGQELTISYTANHDTSKLLSIWGFKCECAACANPTIYLKRALVEQLDAEIIRLGANGKEGAAYHCGESLLRLYDELGCKPAMYSRTYYDMFQMAVRRKSTQKQAKECIAQALRYSILDIGEAPDVGLVKRYRALVGDISKHPQYLSLAAFDKMIPDYNYDSEVPGCEVGGGKISLR